MSNRNKIDNLLVSNEDSPNGINNHLKVRRLLGEFFATGGGDFEAFKEFIRKQNLDDHDTKEWLKGFYQDVESNVF
ncbi:hypothetical protein [Bacillus altitudinis]|uniref:hypothetical protein n=1 Tax=Bacillus altitudinis TaxID=293387 RepID=UPI0015BAA802|nr:hypothetical protein [Bacillus altitudinis]